MVGGEGDDQLWGSGRGAIVGCHCSVLCLGGNFGGVDVVPLPDAIAGCHCTVLWYGRVPWVVFNFSGKTSSYIRTHCCQAVREACSFENGRIKTRQK